MNFEKKFKIDFTILIPIIVFAVISIFTIYSAEGILVEENLYATRQLIWYGVGALITGLIIFIGNEKIINQILFVI